jgi:hypothetical protein
MPEVTSPVDRATLVFYSCFADNNRTSILNRFDVISACLIAENDGKTISAARGRVRPEVKSLFDSFNPIWYICQQ